MKLFVLLILILSLACQSSVRYTSGREVYRTASGDDSSSDNTLINDETGPIDQGKMGKIIASYLRTPYKLGGTGKLGIDCSGLVYVVFRDYNSTRLPTTSRGLYKQLRRVNYKNAHYGDLLFFSFDNSEVSHVGIYVGNSKFVHASKTKGVIISSMTEDYYRTNFKGARRVLW